MVKATATRHVSVGSFKHKISCKLVCLIHEITGGIKLCITNAGIVLFVNVSSMVGSSVNEVNDEIQDGILEYGM